MRLTATLCLSICLSMLLGASLAHGAQVYKWVDEAGVTHFSAVPPDGGRPSETINIRTGQASPANESQDHYDTEPAVETPTSAAPPTARSTTREVDRERCEQALETRDSLANRARARVIDPDTGEYRIVTSDELQSWRDEVEADIRRYCP